MQCIYKEFFSENNMRLNLVKLILTFAIRLQEMFFLTFWRYNAITLTYGWLVLITSKNVLFIVAFEQIKSFVHYSLKMQMKEGLFVPQLE